MPDEYEYVDHPTHYNEDPSGLEAIEAMRWLPHNPAAAIKYLWRMGRKPDQSEVRDMRKALWYIEDEIANGGFTVRLRPKQRTRLREVYDTINSVGFEAGSPREVLLCLLHTYAGAAPERTHLDAMKTARGLLKKCIARLE